MNQWKSCRPQIAPYEHWHRRESLAPCFPSGGYRRKNETRSHSAVSLYAVRQMVEALRALFAGSVVDQVSDTGAFKSARLRYGRPGIEIIMAGRGGNTIKTGRHYVMNDETPLNNLFLSLMDKFGVRMDAFGDSNERLAEV